MSTAAYAELHLHRLLSALGGDRDSLRGETLAINRPDTFFIPSSDGIDVPAETQADRESLLLSFVPILTTVVDNDDSEDFPDENESIESAPRAPDLSRLFDFNNSGSEEDYGKPDDDVLPGNNAWAPKRLNRRYKPKPVPLIER